MGNLRKLTPHLRCQNMNPKVEETLNAIGTIIMRRARFGELRVSDDVRNACVLAEKLNTYRFHLCSIFCVLYYYYSNF